MRIYIVLESVIVGGVAWFAIFALVWELTWPNDNLAHVLGICGGLALCFLWFRFRNRGGGAKIDSVWGALFWDATVKGTIGFAQAEKEVESQNVDPELWSIALAKANGDESKRKVEYMKLRAKQKAC